ncbi:MAG: hypothetical protein IAF94_21015, partial [Pirellulaceae bacterium]|nr:hypothetical protein [Pirellulaceae bacterium]
MAIAVKFTSDDGEMQRSYEKAIANAEKYRAKLEAAQKAGKETGKAVKDGADAGSSAIGGMIGKLGGMVAGYVSLEAGIQLVNAALQDQIDLQEKVANVQKTGADAERALLRNLGNISKTQQADVLAQIAGISKSSGVSHDVLKSAAAEAVSARGNLTIPQALAHMGQAARIAPESPSELAASSRALMNIASITGSEDPKRNMAFLTDLMAQSPTSKLSDISQNALPGIAGVMGFGGTAEEAGGLTTVMASAMKDASMASSSTAAIQLARQVKDFTPGGPAEDIAFLQKNPAVRDAFLAKASFEAKALIPSKNILTAGTPEAELAGQSMAGFTPSDRAAGAADAFVSRLDA